MQINFVNAVISIIGYLVIIFAFSYIADFSGKKLTIKKRLIISAVITVIILLIVQLL